MPPRVDASEAEDRQPTAYRRDLRVLDNPIWSSLTTAHSGLALGSGAARRYPAAIGPLSGLASGSPEAYEALREATAAADVAVVFLGKEPEARAGWLTTRTGEIDQMVWEGDELPAAVTVSGSVSVGELRRLTAEDAPAMVELARLTEPGPFEIRTHELGEFYGVVEGGRLLAMAGQRMHVPGMAEVSAVCTHPDARGRGYARRLMLEVMIGMVWRGETPFLHVLSANAAAIRVYEGLGFRLRRRMWFEALQRVG
jgi:ribosomal protein S18 acetylase RimI-like enzyme